MSIQTGPVYLQGTYGNICAYYSNGQWRFRQKSTLTGKRVKTSPLFRNTMLYAGLMKRSSKIASVVYAALPGNWKQFWMYRAFVGEAMGLLKDGQTDAQTLGLLWERYAAEFVEGYEEGKGFVHAGVGEAWEYVREVRIFREDDPVDVGKYDTGMGKRRKRARVLKRCYEELVE